MAQRQIQSSALPPAQPSYILRGHDAQIHSVCFLRRNARLLTGDAQGWLVLWNVTSKRAVAVWRAHEGAILGLSSWGDDKIITHGRDTKLLVWQIRESDEPSMSSVLPIEDAISKRPNPWLLHSLDVNTLNFCSFAKCSASQSRENNDESIFVAVPGRREGEIEIYSLPSQERIYTINIPKGIKTGEYGARGMVMALAITHLHGELIVIAGYENGHTCLWERDDSRSSWKAASTTKAHSQPVLSLDLAKSHNMYLTSAADAIVASHPLTSAETSSGSDKQIQTKHSGQQALTVRCDQKIFATAGWDGRIRVYSAKTLRELAVLKWHTQGCYALAFADLDTSLPEKVSSDVSDTQVAAATYLTVEQKRNIKAQTTHWLAAGAKDGKVSLWDIY